MCKRVLDYFKKCVSPELLKEVRGNFDGDFIQIFDDVRKYDGETSFFADRMHMDMKTYNRKFADMCRRSVDCVVSLAEDGIKYRKMMNQIESHLSNRIGFAENVKQSMSETIEK